MVQRLNPSSPLATTAPLSAVSGASLRVPRPGDLPLLRLRSLAAMPAVSVLITSFNYGRFLARAIESALQQSWRPVEIIVSDDGSEDNSCQIAEFFIDRGEPVALLRGKHGGMAASLNAAVRAASGDILCLLDADDYFLRGKIEAVVSAFRSHPDAGFAVHRTQRIDAEGRQRGVYPLLHALPRGNCAGVTIGSAGILMGLPPTSSLSLRREVAAQIFPVPEYLTGYAEQMIHRIAPLVTSLCAIETPLSVWRLHGRNDANSSHVACGRLQRELACMRQLWREQRSFLMEQDPESARDLPALETNALFLRMQYMCMRLTGDPAARDVHAALCAIPDSQRVPADLFWRHSLRLPRPLFQKCMDLLEAQSIWKEWLAHLLRRKQPPAHQPAVG